MGQMPYGDRGCGVYGAKVDCSQCQAARCSRVLQTYFREHLLQRWVNRRPRLMRQASLDGTITIGEYTTS